MPGLGSLPLRARAGAALAVALWFVTASIQAASIDLRVELDCTTGTGPGNCRARAENSGSEPAHEPALRFELDGRSFGDGARPRLDPGARIEAAFPLPPEGLPPGDHAATLSVSYCDALGSPLSAVTAVLVRSGVDPGSQPTFSGTIAEPTATLPATLNVELENRGDAPAELLVRWHLPLELAASPPTQALTILPGGRATASFEITSAAANPGSSYGVYAVAESDSGGARSTLLLPARVSIAAERRARWPRVATGAGLAALIFAIVVAELRARATQNVAASA